MRPVDLATVLTTMSDYAAERASNGNAFLAHHNIELLRAISFTLKAGAAKCREIAERDAQNP